LRNRIVEGSVPETSFFSPPIFRTSPLQQKVSQRDGAMYKELITALISVGFAGLGAPLLQQLRELIKDIWYRNTQERVGGELENERRRLELGRGFRIQNNRKRDRGDHMKKRVP
jgi:hypothetical protein